MLNILIIIFAQFERSFVSAFFILVAQLLLFTPTMPVQQRLNWDLIFLVLNLAILVGVIVAKQSMDQHPSGMERDELQNNVYTYMSLGFVIKSQGVGSFDTHPILSYKVEAFMALVHLLGLYFVCYFKSCYAYYDAHRKDVLVIRFFDFCSGDKLHHRQHERLKSPVVKAGLGTRNIETKQAREQRKNLLKQFKHYHEYIN